MYLALLLIAHPTPRKVPSFPCYDGVPCPKEIFMHNKHKKPRPPLGSGARFSALTQQLASRPGVRNPAALAAFIGRKKYGAQRFAQLGAHGRKG